MASLPINLFDAAVYLCLAVAVIAGFRSGLLRSLATIFGYLVAAGLAVALTPPLSRLLVVQFDMPSAQIWAARRRAATWPGTMILSQARRLFLCSDRL